VSDNQKSKTDTINLKILFFAKLKEIVGAPHILLEMEQGSKVKDLKKILISQYPGIEDYQTALLVSINQNFSFDEDLLNNQDEIAFFPPVSGGQTDENDIFEITYDELEFNALITKAILNQTGAIVMFTGVIRGETAQADHPVTTGLECEAYIPMAEAKMRQVGAEIRQQWPSIQKIFIIQRIGYMDAMTPTVIVLCTAAHRNTGVFEAAKYGIDRIKEIVPIWKKEIGPDDNTWIEGDYLPKHGD